MKDDTFPVGDQMDQKTGQYDGDRVRYDYDIQPDGGRSKCV